MATCNPVDNGRKRSLADELDRFDAIVDGLADALTEAVAQAVKEALLTVRTDEPGRPCPGGFSAPPPRSARPVWCERLRQAAQQTRRLIGLVRRPLRQARPSCPARPPRRPAAFVSWTFYALCRIARRVTTTIPARGVWAVWQPADGLLILAAGLATALAAHAAGPGRPS